MKIILIVKEDITLFPPVQTLILTLCEIGCEVVVLGHYSDSVAKRGLESIGVKFEDTGFYDVRSSLMSKLKGNILFRNRVFRILDSMQLSGSDYRLWIIQGKTISLLHNLTAKHPCILHPLEFVDKKINLFYRFLSPRYDAAKTFQRAFRVVNCEYNRAQILKGILNLPVLPVVLPNKMAVDETALATPPQDIVDLLREVSAKVEGKRVIIYQGIFIKGERRLEEFCRAVSLLGKDYVLLIMGATDSRACRELMDKFADASIIFVPFVRPPYHLLVTRLAHIGILTYFPRPDNWATVINPLYCAPNKIFEYGRFGIPMIGNDIPGLHYIFREFHCGQCVCYPMTEERIKAAIEEIFAEYDEFSKGALNYFESVNVKEIVSGVI